MRLGIIGVLLMTMACKDVSPINKEISETEASVPQEMAKTTKRLKEGLSAKGFMLMKKRKILS